MTSVTRLVIACLLVNMSCNKSVSYDEALTKNRGQFADAGELEDAGFLVESKSRSMLVIKVLTLAADSGYSAIVVNFAKQSLTEHQALDEQIEDLANKKDVSLPDELSAHHQSFLSQLSSARRQDFDDSFIRIISRMNEDNISLFTVKASQASDPDIRAFAARKLDLLRAHSRLISTMRSQLLNTTE